jgi:uncharacterized protein (TIGR03435 family)
MTHSKTIVLAAMVSIGVYAQPKPTAFEVASVKLNKANDRRIGIEFLPGGRLVITNVPLLIIIAHAYRVPFNSSPRLSGGPDWIRAERYDIEARAEKGAIAPNISSEARGQLMRSMLQSLLADRFKLAVRHDTKEMAVYAVVPAKDGPKLERAKVQENDCPEARTSEGFACHEFAGGQGRGLHGQAVTISDLAYYVENWAEHPVIDKTGIKGLFHIETKPWISMQPGPAPPAGAKGEDGSDVADLPTLFTVFANLGLKLEAQRAAVEVYEITHVERPAEN